MKANRLTVPLGMPVRTPEVAMLWMYEQRACGVLAPKSVKR